MKELTIKSIRDETLMRLKSCWAELAFIIMLAGGVVCFTYAAIIFLSQMMGIHSSYYAVPLFSQITPAYVIHSFLLVLVVYLGSMPLFFGIRWFYWHLSGGAVMSLDSLFACYDSRQMIRRCILVRLMTDLRKLARMLVLGTLGYALFFVLGHVSDASERTIQSIETFIVFILLVLYYVSVMDLAFVPYIFADNPDLPVGEIMKRSKRAVRYNRTFSVKLFFSCIPWFLTGIFIFPLMFVFPTVNILHAIYLRRLLEDNIFDEKKA